MSLLDLVHCDPIDRLPISDKQRRVITKFHGSNNYRDIINPVHTSGCDVWLDKMLKNEREIYQFALPSYCRSDKRCNPYLYKLRCVWYLYDPY